MLCGHVGIQRREKEIFHGHGFPLLVNSGNCFFSVSLTFTTATCATITDLGCRQKKAMSYLESWFNARLKCVSKNVKFFNNFNI